VIWWIGAVGLTALTMYCVQLALDASVHVPCPVFVWLHTTSRLKPSNGSVSHVTAASVVCV